MLWTWTNRILVFHNPCKGTVDIDSDGKPILCDPLQEEPCREGYFCLAGDTSIVNNSFCCPAVASKIFSNAKKNDLSEDPCNTYLNEGEGMLNLKRWYFNPITGRCLMFVYRGVKGNENNFLNEQQCVERCVPCKESPWKTHSFSSI